MREFSDIVNKAIYLGKANNRGNASVIDRRMNTVAYIYVCPSSSHSSYRQAHKRVHRER
jgi:hypothetical protein